MEKRGLGHSGMAVSPLSLGSWKTFEFMTRDLAVAVLNAALDTGINFLDDARYDDTTGKAPLKSGYSEVVFGELLAACTARREDLIISNRLWLEFYPQQSLEQEIDASLARIGIEYFDLVFCVPPPEGTALPVLIEQLGRLIATGKVRYWGPANWTTAQLAEACRLAKLSGTPLPTAAMLPYSLLNRASVENERLSELCAKNSIGLVASFSLAGGILTGKFNDSKLPRSLRNNAERVDELRKDGTLDKVERLLNCARELNISATQLALAYCLNNADVTSILFGATSVDQVRENASALEFAQHMDPTLRRVLSELFD
jgi:aryl-alcohol dehydrogenase-like predicted oxidoreductase